jgi:nitrogen regulatory protein P-II 1
MINMILLVLHDPELLEAVTRAWDEAGAPGITILSSLGTGRLRHKSGLRDDLPLIPSLHDLLDNEELYNRTLFTIVEGDDTVARIVNATQQVTGDLDEPDSGILIVLPISQAYGLHRKRNP